jgi:hypothetical protein
MQEHLSMSRRYRVTKYGAQVHRLAVKQARLFSASLLLQVSSVEENQDTSAGMPEKI